MGTVSGRPAAGSWDIRRLPLDDGADASAVWTETYAARVLGMALTAQPEFWAHVATVRAGDDPSTLARRYVKRDVGRRVELIVAYIERAAAGLDVGRGFAKTDVWNIAARAWGVGPTPSDPRGPIRALREDAAESMARAALRVARRGAGRCGDPNCCAVDRGTAGPWLERVATKLARETRGDYCSVCAPRQPDRRSDIEAERVLFDRAVSAVFGDDSRPRLRRLAAIRDGHT